MIKCGDELDAQSVPVTAQANGDPHKDSKLGYLRVLGVFVVLLALTLLNQKITGAFTGSFGAQPDEAGHYVTGVMIRDYLASGFRVRPLAFAQDFYIHYPRV